MKGPYRVGRKQKRAVLDSTGHEVCIFKTGSEVEAQKYCDYLNSLDSEIKKELTKEDLLNRQMSLNVGELKAFLNKTNLPDNAPVLLQRIEDVYFNTHGWGVYLKDDPFYRTDEKEFKDQYFPAFSCVYYKDDEDILFITAHY